MAWPWLSPPLNRHAWPAGNADGWRRSRRTAPGRTSPPGFRHSAGPGAAGSFGFGKESPTGRLVCASRRPGGRAEAASLPLSPGEHISTSFIRIHPRRIVACSIRPGWPGLHARDMPAEEAGQ
jgi:hypothetical protein